MVKMGITVMYSDGNMMWRELNESILLEGTPLCEGR